jgi:hypothetical protein
VGRSAAGWGGSWCVPLLLVPLLLVPLLLLLLLLPGC